MKTSIAFLSWLQAEYVAKASGEGANEKSILDSLKQSYTTKIKELEEAEVRGALVVILYTPSKERVLPARPLALSPNVAITKTGHAVSKSVRMMKNKGPAGEDIEQPTSLGIDSTKVPDTIRNLTPQVWGPSRPEFARLFCLPPYGRRTKLEIWQGFPGAKPIAS